MIQANFTPDQNVIFKQITQQLDDIILLDMPWDNMVSLSGAAGTGKTYLIAHLIKHFNNKYSVAVTAPTHKALKVIRDSLIAHNIEDVILKTIHSFLNITLVTDLSKGIQYFQPEKNKKDVRKVDILVIDESSMISTELYNYIEDTIVEQRVKAILFVGDHYQLLPIDNTKNQVFDISHQYKLSKIIRQVQDSYIIKVATHARDIIKSKNYQSVQKFFFQNKDIGLEFFYNEEDFHNDFCQNKYWENEDKIITSFLNKSVEHHNKILRNKYWAQNNKNSNDAIMVGDKLIFQSAHSIDDQLIFQNNDEVVVMSAAKQYHEAWGMHYWKCQDRYQNEFQVIDPGSYFVYKEMLKKLANIAKQAKYPIKQELWKEFFKIKDSFVDVKYHYASTIHKLQGSTYKTVYIDLLYLCRHSSLSGDELYRLIYVAMTRASDDIKILIPPESLK